MPLPFITLKLNNNMYGFPNQGNLAYNYSPFYNLQDSKNKLALGKLTLNAKQARINITEPVFIDTEPSYDDSINLIITDQINPPKIVNSRFYQTSTMTYNIADRKGNLDTNIYSNENFKIEAGLIKSTRTIMTVDFLGIKDGGAMKIGNYTFYFRLADADGNESDFIAESGRVVCHIGTINSPKSIRGGQQDENSNKLIKFKLNNLDLAYDYINIYYTRSTGDGDLEVVKTYKINDKFKITNNDVELSITGYENHEEIALSDINIQYTSFDSVKTLANCQNITFTGNTTNNYELFKTLEKYSLFVTPSVDYDIEGIGNLNSSYNESYLDQGFEYYNAKNIYYKLGYWEDEIYRFGIVYILNDYTLSPVFNIRGRKTINSDTQGHPFTNFNLDENINYTENYLLERNVDPQNPENVKGVFKISPLNPGMFNNDESIKPLGILFTFENNVVEGLNSFIPGLRDLTKGFFIVRQKRIPTILAQSLGIATSEKAYIPVLKGNSDAIVFQYFAQSFIKGYSDSITLGSELFPLEEGGVNNNALLCPEANVRRTLFNTFFNSSEYTLKEANYSPGTKNLSYSTSNNFSFRGLLPQTPSTPYLNSELTLIEPGIELIRNNTFEFCSKAGDPIIAYKHVDPVLGNYEDVTNEETTWNSTTSKVRGEFNTFIGTSVNNILFGQYYNILQKDYNFDNWKDYFNVRYNDSGPFLPVSDRIGWDKLSRAINEESEVYHFTDLCFRGDCYINTYTHRMNWNFIDTEVPTNKRIVDPYTWMKHFKIANKSTLDVVDDSGIPSSTTLSYHKLLLLFTYKEYDEPEWYGDTSDSTHPVANGFLEPDNKKFKKYSEKNGLFGAEKINKADVNAVPLGHWVTFKICSNVNLAMRDLDFTRPEEEAVHKQKRGFYPLQALDPNNHLPESDVINNGISKTLSDRYYYEIPDVPFIKTNFATRIYYSNLLQNSAFTNGNRVFEASNFTDYPREYGAIVKLVEWYGKLIVILEHGILMIPINERAMMTNATGENVYINTATVLPQNPKVISNTFGSLWAESVIKTSKYIYGIDTVGKKIWRTNGETFECISDMKIQKFLNDNILLLESDKDNTIQVNFVKSHYNAFKQDLLFVFKYNDKVWHLCWNELLEKWVTQYTWFPEFSENINNIFYTFANQEIHNGAANYLFKHGFAGTFEELGNIKSTYWYGTQFPFEYEFVVNAIPGIQKIFNNLEIISNLAEPDAFYYEIVGEGFEWTKYKDLILQLNDITLAEIDGVTLPTFSLPKEMSYVDERYFNYLISKPDIKKIPYIYTRNFDVNDETSFYALRPDLSIPIYTDQLKDLNLRKHNKTLEKLIDVYQKGVDIKKYGRVKGNMQYLEDSWNVQVQPISFFYAYVLNEELKGIKNEMKIRDKYVKIRVTYKGDQYAIINAIRTLFTISYA